MILIISDSEDLSTTHVIEWLELFNKKYVRINYEEKIKISFIGIDIEFEGSEFKFKLSDIKSVWYRRGYLNFQFEQVGVKEIDAFLKEEEKNLTEYIYQKLFEKHHLNTINNYRINKLIVTDLASTVGLSTPTSYIFSNQKDIRDLVSKNDSEFITKSICGDPSIIFNDFLILNYTSKIRIDENSKIKNVYPSLIQNYINKKYELRIFYMKGECYSMAIFSQNDEKTKTDFRDFDKNKPNRRVPFKLPIEIAEKISALMRKLNLDTGSVDMIVTSENEFVFLEVNPVGQFGMTSFPCNYNIEKVIAKYL